MAHNENDLFEITKESIGLNFSDLERICQDFLKNTLIYGKEKSNLEFIRELINSRKKPF